ncbi:hypothetical protein [Limnoglobus roseus]|uniref:Uncharacterized protein n=1 Tax=Limnoglobus roseus TaxID=2598579 RepID=A0A5C1A5G3_9BACT|nr:hypothetical protein [Limnoglobus roseus]QEL13266.1 hypothetical protein PX52LOC_00120 [Limnoglobus roseus]
MQLFCPDCQAAFAGTPHCPKCGGRLIAPQESFVTAVVASAEELPEAVQTTFPGRVVLGTTTALGLFLSLREFAIAFTAGSSTTGDIDVFTICGLRLLAVAAGGLLTGAGRANGAQPGFATGLLVGGLLTAHDILQSGGAEYWWPIGLAVGFPVVAAIAGWIGARIWPAAVDLPNVATPTAVTASRASTLTRLSESNERRRGERPTVWLRILIGGLLAFAAIVTSEPIRMFLARASSGLFNTGGMNRAAAVGAQLAAIILVLGGMVAGANTGAGMRHGFYTALFTALNLFGAVLVRGKPDYPPVTGLFAYLDLPLDSYFAPQSMAVILAFLIGLVTAGGWLGGQLFPPLAPAWMRKRKLHQQG